jgi:hypothetical protein
MSYDVSVRRLPHYYRVQVTGEPTFDQLVSLVHLLGVQSSGWKHDRVLVDLRQVEALYTPEEQFRMGEELALSLSHMQRIASVVPTHRVTRISERAAQRSGVQLQVFDSEPEAIAWLAPPA